MSKKHKQQEEQPMAQEPSIIIAELKKAPVVFNNTAYSMFEGNGKYHVVAVNFNDRTLESGEVKIIESNTEKLIIQERLQVLLLGADFI